MNALTEKLTKHYCPSLALIVYTNNNAWDEAYIESHIVNKKGQLLEGKPLKQETLNGIVDVFFDTRKEKSTVKGIMPEHLLFFSTNLGDGYKMIWHRGFEKRQLLFSPSLKIPSGYAWVPPMVYMVDGKDLSVFALLSDSRPDEQTKLFRAPFHNVYEDGRVCLGSAKAKKPEQNTFSNLIKYWEDLFWLSEFSHLNGSSPIKGCTLDELWKRLISDAKISVSDKNWREFADPIQSKKSLKDFIA